MWRRQYVRIAEKNYDKLWDSGEYDAKTDDSNQDAFLSVVETKYVLPDKIASNILRVLTTERNQRKTPKACCGKCYHAECKDPACNKQDWHRLYNQLFTITRVHGKYLSYEQAFLMYDELQCRDSKCSGFSQCVNYKLQHVLGSFVIDKWNIDKSEMGVMYCYYSACCPTRIKDISWPEYWDGHEQVDYRLFDIRSARPVFLDNHDD